MSRGTKLQEMEQSKTAVTANATPGDAAMPTAGSNASGVTVAGNSASSRRPWRVLHPKITNQMMILPS